MKPHWCSTILPVCGNGRIFSIFSFINNKWAIFDKWKHIYVYWLYRCHNNLWIAVKHCIFVLYIEKRDIRHLNGVMIFQPISSNRRCNYYWKQFLFYFPAFRYPKYADQVLVLGVIVAISVCYFNNSSSVHHYVLQTLLSYRKSSQHDPYCFSRQSI